MFKRLALLLTLAASPLIEDFDIPLMPGLQERADAHLVFDKGGGSILETVLEGDVPVKQVQSYYISALEGLGWVHIKHADPRDNTLIFQRGSDQLTVELSHVDNQSRLHLLLEPTKR